MTDDGCDDDGDAKVDSNDDACDDDGGMMIMIRTVIGVMTMMMSIIRSCDVIVVELVSSGGTLAFVTMVMCGWLDARMNEWMDG